MAKCRTIGCEGEVFDEDGYCLECGGDRRPVDRENIEDKKIKPKEGTMPRGQVTVESKICVVCKGKYKPTSNVQKRCDDCRKVSKKKIGGGGEK